MLSSNYTQMALISDCDGALSRVATPTVADRCHDSYTCEQLRQIGEDTQPHASRLTDDEPQKIKSSCALRPKLIVDSPAVLMINDLLSTYNMWYSWGGDVPSQGIYDPDYSFSLHAKSPPPGYYDGNTYYSDVGCVRPSFTFDSDLFDDCDDDYEPFDFSTSAFRPHSFNRVSDIRSIPCAHFQDTPIPELCSEIFSRIDNFGDPFHWRDPQDGRTYQVSYPYFSLSDRGYMIIAEMWDEKYPRRSVPLVRNAPKVSFEFQSRDCDDFSPIIEDDDNFLPSSHSHDTYLESVPTSSPGTLESRLLEHYGDKLPQLAHDYHSCDNYAQFLNLRSLRGDYDCAQNDEITSPSSCSEHLTRISVGIFDQFGYMSPFFFLLYDLRLHYLHKGGFVNLGVILTRFSISLHDKYPDRSEWIASFISQQSESILAHASAIFFNHTELQSSDFSTSSFFDILNSIKSNCYLPVVFLVSLMGPLLYSLAAGRFPDINDLSVFATKRVFDANSNIRSFRVTADLLIWSFTGVYDFIVGIIDPNHRKFLDSDPIVACHKLGLEILTSPVPSTIEHHGDVYIYGEKCERYLKLYRHIKSHRTASKIVSSYGGAEDDLDRNHIKVTTKCNAYQKLLSSCAYRKAPYCLCYFGGTSLGKSSLTYLTIQLICIWKGLPTAKEFIYTLSPGSKHWDNFTASKVCLIVDDAGAMRSEHSQPGGDAQVVPLLQIVNNTAFQPPQASLDDKGSTPFNAPIVLITTNVKNLKAPDYMTHAEPILRRVRHTVTIDVHPDYSDGGVLNVSKAAMWTNSNPGKFPPFWLFTVERYAATNSSSEGRVKISGSFIAINFEGVSMVKVEAGIYLRWLKYDVSSQSLEQDMSVASSGLNLDICQECSYPRSHCVCSPELNDSFEPQSVDSVINIDNCVNLSIFISICCLIRIVYTWIRHIYTRASLFVDRVALVLRDYDVGFRKIADASTLVNRHEVAIDEAAAFVADVKDNITSVRSKVSGVYSHVTKDRAICALGALAAFILFLKVYRTGSSVPHGTSFSSEASSRNPGSDFGVINTPVSETTVKGWGEGRPPQSFNASNVEFLSPISRTAGGPTNHKNVNDFISRCVGRARVTSIVSGSTTRTEANCVILGGGFVLLNTHSIEKHSTNNVITLSISCSHERIDEFSYRPASGWYGSISPRQIFLIPEKDMALIYIPGFTRRGCYEYFIQSKSFSPMSDPWLFGRTKDGESVRRKVRGARSILANVTLYDVISIDKAIVYELETGVTQKGDSGSLYCIHLGDSDRGSYGAICIAGVHCAAQGDRSVAVCVDQKDIAEWKEKCLHKFSFEATCHNSAFVTAQSSNSSVIDSGNIFMIDNEEMSSLGPTHRKSCFSYFNFENRSWMDIYGHLNGFRSTQGTSSQYKVTSWSGYLDSLSRHDVLGDLRNTFLPAICSYNDVWKVHRLAALSSLTTESRVLPQYVLDFAASSYLSDVEARADPSTFDVIKPFSIHEAINGCPVFGSLDFSTGAGFRFGKKKHHYFDVVEHSTGRYRVPHDDIKTLISDMESMLRTGCDPNAVFSAHIKDEVRSADKVRDFKIRVMNGSPLPYTILMRRYLMGIILFMQRNQYATECMVFLNPESFQWTVFARWLQSKGGTSRFIDGDYTDFDKNQKINVSTTASDVMYAFILRFAAKVNWNEGDLLAARTLLTSLCNPKIDFFSTLISALGTNPSGHSLTVQKNCIVNSLYMRCVFIVLWTREVKIAMPLTAYSENICQANYGDDVVAGISDSCSWFNHRSIRDTLESFSVPYTRADKSAITDSNLYTDFSDISFLKRKWVWDDDFNAYRAPIEAKSIVRGLHYFERKSLSDPEHHVSILEAMNELALTLGRSHYSNVLLLLKDLSTKISGGYGTYFNPRPYDDYIERFHANSAPKLFIIPEFQCESKGIAVPILDGKIRHVGNSYLSQNLETQLVEREDSLQRGLVAIVFCAHTEFQNSQSFGRDCVLNRPAQTLLNFIDNTPGEILSAPGVSDETFNSGYDQDAQFIDWFSRPVKIATYSWTENTSLNYSIQPWYEYFMNAQILNKIKGFSRLRATLRVKVVINASPFQYSLGLMSYRPLCGVNAVDALSGGANNNTALTDADLMVHTQYPHVMFWPQTSQGCEMEIPFLYHSNWIELDSLGNSLKDMGQLYFKSFVPLWNASGHPGANPINVSVYAWASDVKLSGPSLVLQADEYSVRPVSMIASSVSVAARALSNIPIIGKYMKATSMVADAAAGLAYWFGYTNVPLIEPVPSFRIAPSSGLCDPTGRIQPEKIAMDPKNELNVDPSTVGLDGADDMAVYNILNRDVFCSSFVWASTDVFDTNLCSFYVNPSIYTSSFVTVSGAGTTNSTYCKLQMTPACLLSQMHEYWRGDMEYVFIAPASKFHRGRLRFTFDPNGPWTGTPNAMLHQTIWDISESPIFRLRIPYQAATAYLKNDYNASVSTSAVSLISPALAFPSLAYAPGFYNGVVQVEVINELTAPAGGNVEVQMFVNARNIEFASPNSTESTSQYMFSTPQSDDVEPSEEAVGVISTIQFQPVDHTIFMGEVCCPSVRNIIHRSSFWTRLSPGLTPSLRLNGGSGQDFYANGDLVNFRRGVLRFLIPRIPIPAHVTTYPVAPNFAPLDGSYPWSFFVDSGGTNLVGSNAHTLNMTLISSCYALQRGSILWRCFVDMPHNTKGDPSASYSSVEISPARESWASDRPTSTTGLHASLTGINNFMAGGHITYMEGNADSTSLATFAHNCVLRQKFFSALSSGFAGVSRACLEVSNQLEAILPHYSPYRAFPANPLSYQKQLVGYNGTKFPAQTSDTFSLSMILTNNHGVDDEYMDSLPCIDMYACAGPDYSLFKFLAVPTLYRYVNLTTLRPSLSVVHAGN